mgnify:CR=1 FL=1
MLDGYCCCCRHLLLAFPLLLRCLLLGVLTAHGCIAAARLPLHYDERLNSVQGLAGAGELCAAHPLPYLIRCCGTTLTRRQGNAPADGRMGAG